MNEPVIALAASPRDWSQRLHRHVTDHGGAVVRVTVLHPDDALMEPYDVLIADDTTSFLTRNLVEQLRRRGRRVLGVFDPEDPRGKQDLLDLAVDDVIERGAEAAEFVQAVAALVGDAAVLGGADLDATATPTANAPAQDAAAVPLLAVAGAGGGVGTSEIAAALAFAAAARGRRTILVDADDSGPSLAQRLGAAPYPNLRSAVDAVEHRAGELSRTLVAVHPGAVLLPGLAAAQDWAHLRPAEVLAATLRLRTLADVVLVDVGHGVEDLGAWGGPPRHGLARALLGAADLTAVVATGTPVGVARLLSWSAEARPVIGDRTLHVLVNRAPRSAFARRELRMEIEAAVEGSSCSFLPTDSRVEQAAWAGERVARGPFRRAVEQAASDLLSLPAARRRPRWGRAEVRA